MSDELTAERVAEQIQDMCIIDHGDGGYLFRLTKAEELITAALAQAERERDEAYASLTACSEAGIQVTRQKNTYRNRALALLQKSRQHRGERDANDGIQDAFNLGLRALDKARADAIAAEARAASLEALPPAAAERDTLRAALSDMIDLVLDGCVNSMALPEYLQDGDTITVERGYADKFRAAHAALAAAAQDDDWKHRLEIHDVQGKAWDDGYAAGYASARADAAKVAEDRIAKYHERIEFVQSLGETGPWVEQDWAFEAGAIAVRIRALSPAAAPGDETETR